MSENISRNYHHVNSHSYTPQWIQLDSEDYNQICDPCIKRLRESCSFRNLVIRSQKQLLDEICNSELMIVTFILLIAMWEVCIASSVYFCGKTIVLKHDLSIPIPVVYLWTLIFIFNNNLVHDKVYFKKKTSKSTIS